MTADPLPDTHLRRSTYWRAVGACAAFSVLLRFRFLFTPLSTDEGGILVVSRAWAHGGDLYADVWMDRPQALFITFRILDSLTGGTTVAVRVMAMLFGVLAVVSTAEIARRLVSPRAGIVAGLLAAVTSSAPVIDGFTASGELLSCSVSAAAIAAATLVLVGRLDDRWLVAAGALAGLALAMKQSGFDGLVVIGLWLTIAFVLGWGGRRTVLHRTGMFVVGVSSVWLLVILHAALTGWRDWWYAVIDYRLQTRSIRVSWDRFFRTMRAARPILLPVALVAGGTGLFVLAVRRSAALRRLRPEHALIPLWLLVAVASFLMGGQFYSHYWIILTLPLSVVAGAIVGSLRRRHFVVVLAAAAVAPALWSAQLVITLPRTEVPFVIGQSESSSRQEHIAQWFKEERRPTDSLYVLCADSSIYALADIDPPYPALWFYEVHYLRGAQDLLNEMLTSDDKPTFVVASQKPTDCGLKGKDAHLLDDNYDEYLTIDGTSIYIRDDDPRLPPDR